MGGEYEAYDALASATVAADPNGCPTDPATAQVADRIDFGRGRPLQRQIFLDDTGTSDVATLQGAVVRFYTTDLPATTTEADPAESLALGDAFPNPARGTVVVPYRLAAPGSIRLTVLDVLGREVAVLAAGERPAGAHEARLETPRLAAGVYTVRLTTSDAQQSRRVVVVR